MGFNGFLPVRPDWLMRTHPQPTGWVEMRESRAKAPRKECVNDSFLMFFCNQLKIAINSKRSISCGLPKIDHDYSGLY